VYSPKPWVGCVSMLICFELATTSAIAAEPEVRVVREARPDRGTTGLYLANRAPLRPTAFQKLPPGAVKPGGWLRHQLELDANGLVGLLPELSHFLRYEQNGWVDAQAQDGWEELPYWLRGYGDLGYVLGDQAIIATARKWIDGILRAQHADGYFGPTRLKTAERGMPDLWPHMLVLDSLQSYFEYSGDARVIPFMLRYFHWQDFQPLASYQVGWGSLRWADNLAVIHWLYNKTGEAWLLTLARKIHENSVDYTSKIPNWHNVNLAQGIREPAEFSLQADDPKFLVATERNYQTIMGNWGQFPGGGFAGDENIRKAYRDPRQGFETCGYAEYMHTFEIMTRLSGAPVWSDRCEEIAFNSLPAALTPDHKGIHYITCANSVQLDGEKKGNQFQNDFPMLAYKPGVYDYRCCPHNYGMAWSFYAEELWLATADNGLCASLYSASTVKARVGDGAEVQIIEETDYPFDPAITFTIKTPKAVTFPLYLRVPRWCEGASLEVNGRLVAIKAEPSAYVFVHREWHDGDWVTLRLPMHVSVRRWSQNKNSVSVDYGPLTFSLAIAETWSRHGGSDAWPEYNVLPGSPWNYGLVLRGHDPAQGIEVVRKPGPLSSNPFTHEGAPIQLRARARKIPAWQADHDNVVGVLRSGPIRSTEPDETVTLIPMGAARLRITAFPRIAAGSEARDWPPPMVVPMVTASFAGIDRPAALSFETEPTSSDDDNVPRFTWWDHKGTTEWVQYEFDKAIMASQATVYWFDDTGTGGCRVPESWRLLYRDGTCWKPIADPSAYGAALNQDNRVTFRSVTTSALRLEVRLKPGFSGGILRWRVDPALENR
jgi:Beta-L-arabinofuranosidase, GH127